MNQSVSLGHRPCRQLQCRDTQPDARETTGLQGGGWTREVTSGRALRIWREDAAALQAAWEALGWDTPSSNIFRSSLSSARWQAPMCVSFHDIWSHLPHAQADMLHWMQKVNVISRGCTHHGSAADSSQFTALGGKSWFQRRAEHGKTQRKRRLGLE